MQIVVTFDSFEEFDAFRGSGQPVKNTKSRKQAKEEAPVDTTVTEEEPVEEKAVTEEKPETTATAAAPTMEEVRAVLGKLQKAGRRDEVKKLLNSVGAEKLPEVDPKHYAELIQKAGELDA